MSKKNKSSWYSWGGGWGGSYSWGWYSSYYDSYLSQFASTEERRKFKKKVKDISTENFVPIDIRTWFGATEFFKRRRLTININEKEISKYVGKEKEIVDIYDKLPYNSDYIDNIVAIEMLRKDDESLKKIWEFKQKDASFDAPHMRDMIDNYKNWKETYANVRAMFRKLTPKESELFAPSWWWFNGTGKVGNMVKFSSKGLYLKNIRIIQSRIKLRDYTLHEESLRKGKRINRNFINGSSYKPLVSKTTLSQKRKKLFFILDCSGSMGSGNNVTDPSYQAISFAAAAVNSWLFDCDHVIYHSSSGWANVIKDIKKWDLYNLAWWSEGFEHLPDNLDKQWLAWVDYIVALTDLCIWSDAEQGLHDYLKSWRKHMVLSFQNKWTLKWMNVRTIKKTSDMLNALVTLVG